MRRILLVTLSLVAASLAGVAAGDHLQASDGREVAFDHKTGNEWWVEVVLGGADARDVSGVQARDDDTGWRQLTLRDWGAWAASFRIEPGHRVWFRATFVDGTTVESCPFTHPDGVEQCDAAPPPPGDAAFAFDHKTGNSWWVEVLIEPRPHAAQARDTGGEWRTLTLRDWGAWAASFRIEPGHDVQFRAQDAAGSWRESCWFTHPEGVARCGEDVPPDDADAPFEAAFDPKPGNSWWVEVYVDANEPLAGVDARVVGEAWHALTKRSWGAWAASFHVPDGSRVEFRATSADGDADLSGRYAWPSATPVDEPQNVWPREGSFVKYVAYESESVPGYRDWTEANVTFTYTGGAWEMTCEGWRYTDVDGRFASERILETRSVAGPPRGPTWEVRAGDWASMHGVPCVWSGASGTVFGPNETQTTRRGEAVVASAWRVSYNPVWPQSTHGAWETSLGLTLRWSDLRSHSGNRGELVDTDAPIAVGDAPASPPARHEWPFEGSYANYASRLVTDEHAWWANASYAFRDGFWQQTCAIHERSASRGDSFRTMHAARAPPVLGTDVDEGDHVEAPWQRECSWWNMQLVARGQFPERTVRHGEPHTALAWWADELPEDERQDVDRDAWWDADVGLMLRWEQQDAEGRLRDTDAPLSSA